MATTPTHAQPARLLPASGYARMRWKNGAGWTDEIIKVPATDAWHWRLSIAEIEQDAPFSRFPGVERELVLLSGNGVRLAFDDGESRTLLPPHGRLRFAGERGVRGELVDGATRDFNLMWKRDAVDAQLWHRPLVGTMVVFVDPDETWAVHVLAGRAALQGDAGLGGITQGDTALLEGAGQRRRYVLDGGGEVLLIRIRPAWAPRAGPVPPLP